MARTEDIYWNSHRRNSVMEEARAIRRKYLRYAQAEIVYSLSHKKLLELASAAGAIYRKDNMVLIDRDIFDEYLEQFREVSTKNVDDGIAEGEQTDGTDSAIAGKAGAGNDR